MAELKRTSSALEREKAKTEMLLSQMLPPKIAMQLRDGKKVQAGACFRPHGEHSVNLKWQYGYGLLYGQGLCSLSLSELRASLWQMLMIKHDL